MAESMQDLIQERCGDVPDPRIRPRAGDIWVVVLEKIGPTLVTVQSVFRDLVFVSYQDDAAFRRVRGAMQRDDWVKSATLIQRAQEEFEQW